MLYNLKKLASNLEKMLKAQKWDADVSINSENQSLEVKWNILNKKAFKKLTEEFRWWAQKNQVPIWQHLEFNEQRTQGITAFFLNEDRYFESGDFEVEDLDEEIKEKVAQDMKIIEEVLEEQVTHPIGSGIDLRKEVEAGFEILAQIPLENSKVQFVTKSDFGELSVPLNPSGFKLGKKGTFFAAKLPKKGKFTNQEVAKILWSNLEFAVLFDLDQRKSKEFSDDRTIDFVFKWESPSVLVMEVAQKIIEEVGRPYGIIIEDIFGI